MLSAPLKAATDADSEGVDPAEFQRYFVKHGRYTAGTATRYKPVAHLRRADISASGQGPGDRHALPFGAGHPSGGRQSRFTWATRPRPTAAGVFSPLPMRKTLARGSSSHESACATFLPTPRSLPSGDTRRRSRHRLRDRCPGRVPARPSRAGSSRPCPQFLLATERPLRASRLREDVLPRPEKRQRHFRHARHRSRSGAAWSSCGPTSMSPMCSRSMPMPNLRHSSMASCFRQIRLGISFNPGANDGREFDGGHRGFAPASNLSSGTAHGINHIGWQEGRKICFPRRPCWSERPAAMSYRADDHINVCQLRSCLGQAVAHLLDKRAGAHRRLPSFGLAIAAILIFPERLYVIGVVQVVLRRGSAVLLKVIITCIRGRKACQNRSGKDSRTNEGAHVYLLYARAGFCTRHRSDGLSNEGADGVWPRPRDGQIVCEV